MKRQFPSAQKFTRLLLAMAGAALFTLVPAAWSADMMEQLKSAQGKEFDHHFLSMMIDHHKMGVEMAELVSSHAKSAELKKMAKKTIADQRQEITKMQSLLKGTGKPPMNMSHDDPMMKESMSAMDELKKAKGEEFDSKFAIQMTKHHQAALDMSELAQTRSQTEEVKTLATNILKKQRQEISELSKFKR